MASKRRKIVFLFAAFGRNVNSVRKTCFTKQTPNIHFPDGPQIKQISFFLQAKVCGQLRRRDEQFYYHGMDIVIGICAEFIA
jgi:hypothetical protein